MRQLIAILIIAASSFYLYRRYAMVARTPASPPMPPVLLSPKAEPVLSIEEIAKVRQSAFDADPKVRESALNLLYDLRDPQLTDVLNKSASQDTDEEVRVHSIDLLNKMPEIAAAQGLIKALDDASKEVRLAALRALARSGDLAVAPWIVARLNDYDPDVRVAALSALQQLQEKKKAEFDELAEKLRKEYAQSVERSRQGWR